jgi:hypothetical protein
MLRSALSFCLGKDPIGIDLIEESFVEPVPCGLGERLGVVSGVENVSCGPRLL